MLLKQINRNKEPVQFLFYFVFQYKGMFLTLSLSIRLVGSARADLWILRLIYLAFLLRLRKLSQKVLLWCHHLMAELMVQCPVPRWCGGRQ